MLIARGLVQRGYPVAFVTEDYGQTSSTSHEGIDIYAAYRKGAGLPGIRFLHPVMTGLFKAMHRARADIYYNRMSEITTGMVAAFCRRHRKRFIFATAHTFDCIPALPFCESRRERIGYRYGLRRADAVIAQTEEQRQLLLRHFDVASVVIPNCGHDYGERDGRDDGAGQPRVLWIGRFAPEKRLDRMLDVAERLPGVMFDVVGDGDDHPGVLALKQRAQALANVTLHGRAPYQEMRRFYERTDALLCTSDGEGFPNTFLEAWSQGVPVISTLDPDGVIEREHLGAVACTTDALVEAIGRLVHDDAAKRQAGTNARRHFASHHTIDVFLDRFERVIQEVTSH